MYAPSERSTGVKDRNKYFVVSFLEDIIALAEIDG